MGWVFYVDLVAMISESDFWFPAYPELFVQNIFCQPYRREAIKVWDELTDLPVLSS